MSPGSPAPEIDRLVTFLHEGGHVVDPAHVVQICAGLPKDDKLAAAHLRTHLGPLGIALKHTHALRAVAQLRGNRAHLGHHGIRWEVASWVVDAPAVSARRRRVKSIAAAADVLIQRLREQLEDSPPAFVHLKTGPDLELVMPEIGWCALAACTDATGQALHASLSDRKHLAERVRRMVEGEFGGWLNGAMYAGDAVEPTFSFTINDESVLTLAEWEFASAAARVGHSGSAVDQAQRVLQLLRPHIGLGPEGRSPSEAEIARLLLRVSKFERNSGKVFAEWAAAATHTPATYAPQPLNRAGLEGQMKALRVDRFMITRAMSLEPGEFDTYLARGEMPLETMTRLAAALQLESTNALLGRPAKTLPYIPLHDPESLATFMARFEHISLEETVALQLPAGAQALLQEICSVPFDKRTRWDEAAPPSVLNSVADAVRGADSVLCVRMHTRFVRDLPRQRERLAISMVIGAQPRRVVAQFAPANEEERVPFDTDIDEEWLARFNRQTFVGEDMMRYSNLVTQMRYPQDDSQGHFDTQVIAGVRAFPKDADRAHAAQVRMEAVASLMASVNLEPWVIRSSEAGAQMLSRPVFEAIARCPLVAHHGRPAFNPERFQRLIVAHVVVD